MEALPLVGTLISGIMGMKEGDEQAGIGAERAALEEQETRMELARLAEAQQLNLSSARARSAASGVKAGMGSQKRLVDTMKKKQKQLYGEVAAGGASRAALERRRGEAMGKATKGKAFAGMLSGLGSGLGGML